MMRTTGVFIVWLVLGITAQAASFDCGKAQRKVEHLICDNPGISKLDEELNTAYKAAQQDKQQADITKKAQKQWMKERDDCADAICVKQAYAMRLSTLALRQTMQGHAISELSSSVQAKPKTSTNSKEADKAETVKRVMTKVVIKHFAEEFCEEFLTDFRSMKNMEFVEPIERAERFDDSVWGIYRAQCPDMESFDEYECEPRIAMDLEKMPQDERDNEMKSACRQYRCTENFKHFRLSLTGDEGGRTDDIFYCERAHGPLNRVGATQFDTHGGYTVTDLKRCRALDEVSTRDQYSYSFHHPLDNVNGIVVYKGKHYIFDLRENDNKAHAPEKAEYELEVWGYDRRGDEKQTRLYRSCLFTTAAPGNK